MGKHRYDCKEGQSQASTPDRPCACFASIPHRHRGLVIWSRRDSTRSLNPGAAFVLQQTSDSPKSHGTGHLAVLC